MSSQKNGRCSNDATLHSCSWAQLASSFEVWCFLRSFFFFTNLCETLSLESSLSTSNQSIAAVLCVTAKFSQTPFKLTWIYAEPMITFKHWQAELGQQLLFKLQKDSDKASFCETNISQTLRAFFSSKTKLIIYRPSICFTSTHWWCHTSKFMHRDFDLFLHNSEHTVLPGGWYIYLWALGVQTHQITLS